MKRFSLTVLFIALCITAGAAGFFLTPPLPCVPHSQANHFGYGESGRITLLRPVFFDPSPRPHEDPGIMTYVDGDWPDFGKRPSQPSLSREGAGSMDRVP